MNRQQELKSHLPGIAKVDEDTSSIDNQIMSVASVLAPKLAESSASSDEYDNKDSLSKCEDNSVESEDSNGKLDQKQTHTVQKSSYTVPKSVKKPIKSKAKEAEKCTKGKRKSRAESEADSDSEDDHDPETCGETSQHYLGCHNNDFPLAFNIPSAVKCPDGSNVPFTVPSTVTYDKLYIMVARKLKRFPGLMNLQYHLESDKPRTGATSIQSEELALFKEHLRALIVP
jgi:hypothetical protein